MNILLLGEGAQFYRRRWNRSSGSNPFKQTAQFMGTWTNRGWRHTRTRMVAVRRESAGDISPRQIGWNGSERIESSAFWSSNPSTPPLLPVSLSFSIHVPFPRLLRILSRAQVFIRPYTRHYFPPFFPLDSSHDHPQIYISSGEEASSASVYRAHGRSAVVSTRYDLLLYASIRTFVT